MMIKIVLLIALLMGSSANAQQRQISYFDNADSWIYVWDKTGKKLES